MTGKSVRKSSQGAARQKSYSAPALEKGLDILELLSTEPDGLNITEIAARLERTYGEIFRMLAVLQQRGYLSSLPDTGLYTLSLKMFELSHRFPPIKRLTSVAGPSMKRLAAQTLQSCHLVIYVQGKGQVVVQQDPPTERTFSVRLGAEVPLLNSCSGHLLLAYATVEERNHMYENIPPHHQPAPAGVDTLLDKIHAQGYEHMGSGQSAGVQDIGYPIFDHLGSITAALVVPYVSHLDGSKKESIETVKASIANTAATISAALGYHGEEEELCSTRSP